MKKSNYLKIASTVAAVLLVASAAYASGGGGEHEAAANPLEWVWKILNFVILVVVLVYVGRKPMSDYLAARTEVIKKSLDEARQARELAQKALDEVKVRLQSVDSEVAAIIEAARNSGEKEREHLIEDGKALSARIIEQAKSNIDFEVKRAKDAIREEAVRMTMDLVEKQIAEKLSDAERKSLLEEALVKMEGRN